MSDFLIVPRSILADIRAERDRHLPNETGGFLIGVRRGRHIEVTGLTRQGTGDVATRTSFARSSPSHREHIHRTWRRSEGLESLVGDWHTHPLGTADASSTDLAAWRTLVRTSRRPMVGLIDAGGAAPKLFFASERHRPFARELLVAQASPDHDAYDLPLPARSMLRRLLVPLVPHPSLLRGPRA